MTGKVEDIYCLALYRKSLLIYNLQQGYEIESSYNLNSSQCNLRRDKGQWKHSWRRTYYHVLELKIKSHLV